MFRDVVLPYLRELGTRWECGEASVAQEHFASCFLEHWMFGFARRPGRPGSRRAVLACVPGEQHSLGLTAFGVVLKDLGWSVTFLGRDVPLAAVRRAADTVSADAIVLASVLPEPLAAAAPDINELARTHPLVVGGPAAERGRPALDRRRLLRPDLLAAAHMLTLATTEGQPEEGMMLRSAAASRRAPPQVGPPLPPGRPGRGLRVRHFGVTQIRCYAHHRRRRLRRCGSDVAPSPPRGRRRDRIGTGAERRNEPL